MTVRVASKLPGLDRRRALLLVAALIALKIALLFAFAWNTRFVMDEFAQLGFAKYLPDDFFRTVWPAKAIGYAVFYKIAHLVGWDATSILLAGRIQTALLACATLGVVYASARALGEDRLRALLILLVLLSFSEFIERIFRTRAEPLAVFFAATALLIVVRGKADAARTLLAAGLLSGLAFLTTQKAIYFNVALGAALLVDAALARQYLSGVIRGCWLVLGWLVPIVAYCLVFGGLDPVPIAANLFIGPVEITMQGASAYSGLRTFVVQTLARNAPLYALCLAGMILSLMTIRSLGQPRRITLVFTLVITALVFAHDQPWPYVFVMALPFMALWSLAPFDRFAKDRVALGLVWAAVAVGVTLSLVKNVDYLGHHNRDQLTLVQRAESIVGPDDTYFDGIAMLPNRREPSTLWLDRLYVLRTLAERDESEAYRIFAATPPKVIIWSYRMDAISPVVGPQIEGRYVRIAPNLLVAGRRLQRGQAVIFDAPIAGQYALYAPDGRPLPGEVRVDGKRLAAPFRLDRGQNPLALLSGPDAALLLPLGDYTSSVGPGGDGPDLFAQIYTR